MLLVIDVGNTNIVLGVYDKTELVGHWRISTDRVRTTDEYGMLMMNLFFHDRKVDVKDIKDIIISSVVPPLMPTLERVCLRYFNVILSLLDLVLRLASLLSTIILVK